MNVVSSLCRECRTESVLVLKHLTVVVRVSVGCMVIAKLSVVVLALKK